MVIFCTALVLLLVFIAPMAMKNDEAQMEGDFLRPVRLVCLFHVATIVPYLLYISPDPSRISAFVRAHPDMQDLNVVVLRYAGVQIVGFIALIAGLNSKLPKRIARGLPAVGDHRSAGSCYVAAAIAVFIGCGAWFAYLRSIGGFGFLLAHLDRRTTLVSGMGYLIQMQHFFVFGTALALYAMKFRRTVGVKVAFAILAAGSIVVFASQGGRWPAIRLVLISALVWHYGVRPMRRVPWRGILIAATIIVPYFIVVPVVRQTAGGVFAYGSVKDMVDDVSKSVGRAVNQTSYVETYMFITSHFGPDNLWMGRGWLPLLYAPLPSTIFVDKPPIDDGVYVESIMRGWSDEDARPPVAFRLLYPDSMPPETLGMMYMNFWVPGVIVGMYVLGLAYMTAYRYMQYRHYNLYSILVYAYVLLTFHLSVLRIFDFFLTFSMLSIFFLATVGTSRVVSGRRWLLPRPQDGSDLPAGVARQAVTQFRL